MMSPPCPPSPALLLRVRLSGAFDGPIRPTQRARRSGPFAKRVFGFVTPRHDSWDCHIYAISIGVLLGVNVVIYGSPMECLDM